MRSHCKKSIPFHTYQQKVLHNQQEPLMANQKSFFMTPTQTSYTMIIKSDHPPQKNGFFNSTGKG